MQKNIYILACSDFKKSPGRWHGGRWANIISLSGQISTFWVEHEEKAFLLEAGDIIKFNRGWGQRIDYTEDFVADPNGPRFHKFK